MPVLANEPLSLGCGWGGFGGLVQKFLEELAQLRHKRPFEVSHVVLIPRLLWDEEWRNRFEKEVDIWFILHNGSL